MQTQSGSLLRSQFLRILLMATLALQIGCSPGPSAPDGQWPQGGRNEDAAYFSPLKTLAETNVDQLGQAWEFTNFVVRGRTHRGMETTPLVVGRVMYVTGPWSVVYALDATTGEEIWRYDPEVDGGYARRGCCDVVNRGVAVDDGIVYIATYDGYLVALHANTGKPIWKSDTFIDRSRSYTSTGAPRVAGGNVVIGNAGAEMGVRGYISAYDLKSGKLSWRFFTVPAAPETGDETPDVAEARKTWSTDSRWDLGGGGTVWDSMVYDREENNLIIGTGNGMPHPAWSRSPGGGDNLYLSSIVAIDAATGRKKWHYQTTPADSWDYTATQNLILATLKIGGADRKVVMQAPKNGFFYVIDRINGKLISADKYTHVTWADRVDLATGRPVLAPVSDYSKKPTIVWPSEFGGHNWQPMAFSASTGLVYIPVLEMPMKHETAPQSYKPFSLIQGSIPSGRPFDAQDAALMKGQPKSAAQSVLKAWDPVARKVVWASRPGPFGNGGVLATAGNLTVQGGIDGYLYIYRSTTGKLLRRIYIGTAIMAAPMTYAVDGQQYLAITAGLGGSLGVERLDGMVSFERENRERLLVFKLGGGAVSIPPRVTPQALRSAPKEYRGTAAQVAQGRRLFGDHCSACHGAEGHANNFPNLWNLPPEIHAAFNDIVLRGAFKDAGMADFSDVLTKEDARDIHAYISEPLKESRGP